MWRAIAADNLGEAADGSPQYGALTAPGNAPRVLPVSGMLNREDHTMAYYSSRRPAMRDALAKPTSRPSSPTGASMAGSREAL